MHITFMFCGDRKIVFVGPPLEAYRHASGEAEATEADLLLAVEYGDVGYVDQHTVDGKLAMDVDCIL